MKWTRRTRMKDTLFVIGLLVFWGAGYSQQLSRSVFCSSGNIVEGGTYNYSYTIGEPVVINGSTLADGRSVEQGFQQKSVRISLDPLADLSTAFSPNGDGSNDFWFLDNIEEYSGNVVKIYNRWGDLLRTLQEYDNESVRWEGNDDSGSLLPSGTYYYIIELPDGRTDAGWVQLLK